jgi:hypothetical protein
MNTKQKGSIGVAHVITHCVEKGYQVYLPFDENSRFDLIVYRHQGSLERVQVKYSKSNGKVLKVKCRSTNNWQNKKYTVAEIDWIAAFDTLTKQLYFIHSDYVGDNGKNIIHLRLTKPANGQKSGILWAKDFQNF